MTPYRLGTLAFCIGTAVWAAQGVDAAVVAYALGCAAFVDDAFALRARVRVLLRARTTSPSPSPRAPAPAPAPAPSTSTSTSTPSSSPPPRASTKAPARVTSYQLGTLAYAAGTLAWGVAAWRATHAVDVAAALYAVGCAYFLVDAFAVRVPRLPLTSAQLGALAFLAGTIAWALASGVSVPVAAYGLGCLFFVQDAFKRSPSAVTTSSAGAPA